MSRAFSLVELSIVIIIIALLTASVAAGRQLLEKSRLQYDINKFEEFKVAIANFNTLYNFAIPGDFAEASNYWGNDCYGGSGSNTCNGNGDLKIDNGQERMRTITHLKKAKLINEDVYSSTDNGSGQEIFPKGKISKKARFALQGTLNVIRKDGSGLNVAFDYQNFLALGGVDSVTSTSWHPKYGVLTPRQAYNIDIKIDDGTPGGDLYGQIGDEYKSAGVTGKCVNNLTSYDLDESQDTCLLLLRFNSFIAQ